MSEKQPIPWQPGGEHSVYGPPFINSHSISSDASITYDHETGKQPSQEAKTMLVYDPRVLQRMKIYRASLFLTWLFTLIIYIIIGTQLYGNHHTSNQSPCVAQFPPPQVNNHTTIPTSPNGLHASTTIEILAPRNTPDYQCIAGFTHEQMVAGLDWMKTKYGASERQWGAPCNMVANLKGQEVLAEWQFRLS